LYIIAGMTLMFVVILTLFLQDFTYC